MDLFQMRFFGAKHLIALSLVFTLNWSKSYGMSQYQSNSLSSLPSEVKQTGESVFPVSNQEEENTPSKINAKIQVFIYSLAVTGSVILNAGFGGGYNS